MLLLSYASIFLQIPLTPYGCNFPVINNKCVELENTSTNIKHSIKKENQFECKWEKTVAHITVWNLYHIITTKEQKQ